MMTKKDISIVIEYSKEKLNTYTNRKVPIGKEQLFITLNKNKKIDPTIIFEIYKNHNNLIPSEYHGNMYKIHKYSGRKTPFVNYWTNLEIILNINGSKNGYYDYSLDDLPNDLPISTLNLYFNNYKHNINKLPDSIVNLNLCGLTNDNYLTHIPKSLQILGCQCNVNLSLLPVIHDNTHDNTHDNKILIKVFTNIFNSVNCLPSYFTQCIFLISSPELINLPDNIELLSISECTKVLHIPLSLKYLSIPMHHPQYNQIVSQLQYENRSHIIANLIGY